MLQLLLSLLYPAEIAIKNVLTFLNADRHHTRLDEEETQEGD